MCGVSEASVLPRSRRSFGIASIVLGILALAVLLLEPTLAFISALLGLYFGLLAREGTSRWMVFVGLAINAVALVLVVLAITNVFPLALS